MMYDHLEEAHTRLFDTVCLYDGQGVLVTSVSDGTPGEFPITAKPLPLKPRGKAVTFLLSDPKFQFRGIRLGYSNFTDLDDGTTKATYFTRKPQRRVRQGLNAENVATLSGPKFGLARHDNELHWGDVVASEAFARTLRNEYPTLKDAVGQTLDEDVKNSVAFSRDFAVGTGFGGQIDLLYKGDKVAWSLDAQKFRLAKAFNHFRELITEARIELSN